MESLWTVADLARYYKTSEAAIRNKVRRRCDTIPMPKKYGRSIRWHPEEVYKHALSLPTLGANQDD